VDIVFDHVKKHIALILWAVYSAVTQSSGEGVSCSTLHNSRILLSVDSNTVLIHVQC